MSVAYPVRLELAVGTGDPPAWVDVSTYVLADEAVTVTWGGSGEDISVEPSRCSFTVDNSDGRFTPGKTTSPYYPLIRVGTGVRISVSVGGTWFVRFTGTADEWAVGWGSPGFATVDVTCTDYLKQLARQQVPAHGLFAETVIADHPRAFFLLDDAGPVANAETTSIPGQLTASISGDAKIDWANTEPPPGMTAKVLRFTPGAGQCYLSGPSEILRVYGATRTGQGSSSTGTAVGAWINVPVAPVGEMFLFGYDGMFWLGLDATMRVTIHSPTEAGADQVTVGPAITPDAWHYVAGRAVFVRISGQVLQTWWHHEFVIDGVTTAVDVAAGSQTKTKLAATLRIGALGGPARAVFSAAGLSAYNWELSGGGNYETHYLAAQGFAGTDTSGQRIIRWLQMAGLDPYNPAVAYIQGGEVYVAAQDAGDTAILALITDVVNAERGAFYADRNGVLTFRSRDQTLYHTAPDVTLAASKLLASPEFSLDDGQLVNDLTVDGASGVTYRTTDDASITQHGRYTATISTLDLSSAAPQSLANWLLHFSAWPTPQCQKIAVELGTPGVSAATVLGLTVGGIVRVTGASVQAPSATIDLQVIGCTEKVERTRYTFELTTAMADEFTAVKGGWILGDATASVLGTTTVLTP